MNSSLFRFILLIVAVCIFAVALAIPPFWDTFAEHYRPKKDSRLAKAECLVCHVEVGQKSHNPYGKDLDKAIHETGEHDLTVKVLLAVESKDSDHDGFTNGEEIEGDTLPGDATSHPPKAEAVQVPVRAQSQEAEPLIPRHSFHPLAVHFPIALFLFGGFLELIGKLRRSEALRSLALWNLAFGALASIVAIPTGVAAWLRLGFALEGTLLVHFGLAIAASVLMLLLTLWRRKGIHDSPAYWITLALSCLAVAAAGHYGALLVYS